MEDNGGGMWVYLGAVFGFCRLEPAGIEATKAGAFAELSLRG